MQTVARLGSDTRLLIVQFHMKKEFVPSVVPGYSEFHKATNRQVGNRNGVKVMESTPDVLLNFFDATDYQLIDAWTASQEDSRDYHEVRYVFCNPAHLDSAGLRPSFIARRKIILDSLGDLVNKNLWQTMAHINPFFIKDNETDQLVLIFDCNSRKSTIILTPIPASVDARFLALLNNDKDLPPIDAVEKPVVALINKANRLKLVGSDVVLEVPEPPTP